MHPLEIVGAVTRPHWNALQQMQAQRSLYTLANAENAAKAL
jgi:hypothetical protein